MSSLEAFFITVKLPSMSEVAQQLIATLRQDDAGIKQVRDIIAQDPALTAKLLRLANSAQFGLPRGVGSLEDAMQMVGMTKVRALSLAACLNQSFPKLPGLDNHEFWRASMACAGYAQWLGNAARIDSQQAWLTGMMLRLGELLMGQANPAVLAEIEALPRLPGQRWAREKRLTGFTEGQITAELAQRWAFPRPIVEALEHSFDPLTHEFFSDLGAVVHLAGLLADLPQATPEAIDDLPYGVLARLTLDPASLKASFPAHDSFLSLG